MFYVIILVDTEQVSYNPFLKRGGDKRSAGVVKIKAAE
jgi:hypothetical protein